MEYWNRHANTEMTPNMMSWDGFNAAWREAEPEVSDDTIREGWMLALEQGTFNKSFWMSMEQFVNLVHFEDGKMENQDW